MEIQLAGFMHRKLPERVHGMRTFCEDVKLKVLELPHAQRLLRRFARVRILVTVDDIPLPDTNDRVEDDGTALLFMQTVGPREAGPSLFPDFIFGGWWHIGLHEYDPFVSEIRRQAESPPVHDSAFWIGNPEMHESRVALLELSKRHATRVDARAIQWRHELGNASESTGERAMTEGGWVTLQEHPRWRYLLDMPGTGWSGRLKLLAHCGRTLLLPPRSHWDWASSKLLPGVHYVSIKDDLSDLVHSIDQLEANRSHAQSMAEMVQQLARDEMTRSAALAHAAQLIVSRLAALAGESLSSSAGSAAAKRSSSRWDARLRKASSSSSSSSSRASSAVEPPSPPADVRTTASPEAQAIALRAAAAVPTSYMVRGSVVRIHPISNSLPDDVFVDEVPPKRVVMEEEEEGEEGSASSYFARNVLGNISTYVYKDEAAYLDHYRKSYFGITRKKTGWDSGRHLEIMASGSIPYFVDLHALPRRTLALYPRDEIAAAMAMRSVSVKNEAVAGGSDGRWYLDRDNFRVDPSTFDKAAYGRLASRVLEHARVHLSSSGMASYVLQTLGLTPFQASPVLFVTHFSTDFTGDSLLYGFQKILGAGAVVDAAFDTDGGFAHPWCDDAHRHLRAKPSLRRAPSTKESGGHVRFSVHGRLAAVEEDVSRDDLPQRVAAHEFGLIVFGSASRTTGDGLLDAAVHAGYSRERIALIYGEDMPYPLDEGLPMEAIQRPSHIPPSVPSIANTSKVGTVFQRELYDEPSSATGEPHHTEQTIMVPGVADRVERKWTTPMRMPLP